MRDEEHIMTDRDADRSSGASRTSYGRYSILERQLQQYVRSGLYPFHMPGHKRVLMPSAALPYALDLTEVKGTDDLHDARGILQSAMKRAAEVFHADRTWFLVNGATCGNLAAVYAAVPFGGTIIAARNCHKSVWHAFELLHLKVHWIMPQPDDAFDICGSVRPSDVEEALKECPQASAVLLTSPTYEGVISDIEGIAAAAHRMGIPVIVDEAHGAHLGLFDADGFPDSAILCGADLVVQSPHKLLPSLTQTALLHLRGSLVDPLRIEHGLDIFESSSPSYPLMVSLDACTGWLLAEGQKAFERWSGNLDRLDERLMELRTLRVLGHGKDAAADHPAIWRHDRSKVLVRAPYGGSGKDLADYLREHRHLETEMSAGRNMLALTTSADTEEAFAALADALLDLDTYLIRHMKSSGNSAAACGNPEEKDSGTDGRKHLMVSRIRPETERTIGEAMDAPGETVPAAESAGRICAEYLYSYPPGIPIIAPGERITEQLLQILDILQKTGTVITHTRSRESGRIAVLREGHFS